MQRTLAAALFSLLPALAAQKSGIIQVTDLRTWSHPTSTRVVLELTGSFQYRAETLEHPDRLSIDIAGARPFIGRQRLLARAVNDPRVSKIRITEPATGKTRVVFELNGPVVFAISRLDAPDRMVIELRTK